MSVKRHSGFEEESARTTTTRELTIADRLMYAISPVHVGITLFVVVSIGLWVFLSSVGKIDDLYVAMHPLIESGVDHPAVEAMRRFESLHWWSEHKNTVILVSVAAVTVICVLYTLAYELWLLPAYRKRRLRR